VLVFRSRSFFLQVRGCFLIQSRVSGPVNNTALRILYKKEGGSLLRSGVFSGPLPGFCNDGVPKFVPTRFSVFSRPDEHRVPFLPHEGGKEGG